jgi:hypothetical protein
MTTKKPWWFTFPITEAGKKAMFEHSCMDMATFVAFERKVLGGEDDEYTDKRGPEFMEMLLRLTASELEAVERLAKDQEFRKDMQRLQAHVGEHMAEWQLKNLEPERAKEINDHLDRILKKKRGSDT